MVIISLSSFHQKVRFDCVFPIEIPLFHEKTLFHFNLSRAYFERFFESCAPDVVPAGAFWELEIWLFWFFQALCPVAVPAGAFWGLEIWLFQFFKPFVRLSCPQGPFGDWKFDFFNFSSPLSSCRARRGLLGAGNLTFLIVQPIIHPYSSLFALIYPYLPLFTLNYPSQGPNSSLFTLFTVAQRPYLTLFTLIYPYTGAFFTLI